MVSQTWSSGSPIRQTSEARERRPRRAPRGGAVEAGACAAAGSGSAVLTESSRIVLRRGAGVGGTPRPPRPRSSTPFAGMTRIRFEGLRSPALSALSRSPVVAAKLHPGGRPLHPPPAWEAWAMLRLLRDPAVTGVLTVALLVAMVALSAPFLLPLVRWVFAAAVEGADDRPIGPSG